IEEEHVAQKVHPSAVDEHRSEDRQERIGAQMAGVDDLQELARDEAVVEDELVKMPAEGKLVEEDAHVRRDQQVVHERDGFRTGAVSQRNHSLPTRDST